MTAIASVWRSVQYYCKTKIRQGLLLPTYGQLEEANIVVQIAKRVDPRGGRLSMA